jgi:hypothetical protein
MPSSTRPYKWETLATIKERNTESPEHLPKALLLGIWRSIPVQKAKRSRDSDREASDIYDYFLAICESKVETINVPERFRAAAIHLEKECVERECVEGPRVHVYPWEINPLTAYKETKENEWMPWVVEIIFAAMQLPNFVDAKIGDEKYSSNSRKPFETR